MYRPPLRLFVIAAVLMAACGLKPAGSKQGTGGSGGGMISTGAAGAGGGGGSAGSPFVPLPDAGIGILLDADLGDGAMGTSTPDANCGAKSKVAVKLPPNILVLLDRSASMSNDIADKSCPVADAGMFGAGGDCGPKSKWAQIIPALTQVVSETESDVNWGLKFFPDNASNVCNVGSTPEVAIAPKNAAAIKAAITKATSTAGGVAPQGPNNMHVIGTPTRAAMTGAATYMRSVTETGPRIILLATDGMPTCPGSGTGMQVGSANDDPAAVCAVIQDTQTAGYKTFVVGIGTSGTTDADAILSSMANAGGLPRAGTPTYYQVNSFADLNAAIHTLVGVAATCTFQIGPPPDDGSQDLAKINVFGDGTEIPRDETHTDGYDYTDASMQSIEVHGPRCKRIMSGEIKDVTVTFKCIVS